MHIKFKTLNIQCFRSIESATLDLQQQGICIVRGVNNYELNASSNGSGKSSIFEAIIYALFEETSFGDRDVSNRLMNSICIVDLTFDVDNVQYRVVRHIKDKKATVSLYKQNEDISARTKTDTNKLILSVLGVSKDIFLDSVILSQTTNCNLSTLSPTARKERLEFLTGTDNVINLYKNELKQKQAKYESKCVQAQLDMSKINGIIEAKNNEIENFRNKIKQIDLELEKHNLLGTQEQIDLQIAQCTDKIDRCNLDIQQLNKVIDKYNSDIQNEESKLEQFNFKIEEVNNQIQQHRDNYKDLQNKIDKYKSEMMFINNNICKVQSQISDIKNSDTCPTCGRKYDNVDEQHIQRTINTKLDEIDNYNKQIETIELNIRDLNDNIKNVEDDIQTLKLSLDNYVVQQQEVQSVISDIKTKSNSSQLDIQENYNTISNQQQLIQQLNNKKQEINKIIVNNKQEYLDLIDGLNIDILHLNEDLNRYKQEFNVNNDYIDVIKHIGQLVTKEFRTYLLQNSIKYLNNKLLQYSKCLFSNSTDIIHINSDDNKLDILLGDASYESLSGGEKTRVDIALLLAQKSLADNLGDISYNIIVLDEMLKYCDSTTELSIIDLLVTELDDVESIYMISHKEIPIGYDKQVIVTKSEQGLSSVKVI